MTAGFWCAVARAATSALLQRPQKCHAIELPFAATHSASFRKFARHARTSFPGGLVIRFTRGGFHRCPTLLRVLDSVKRCAAASPCYASYPRDQAPSFVTHLSWKLCFPAPASDRRARPCPRRRSRASKDSGITKQKLGNEGKIRSQTKLEILL